MACVMQAGTETLEWQDMDTLLSLAFLGLYEDFPEWWNT